MKRRLGRFLSIAVMLTLPLIGALDARAKTNLQIELVGPLVICETSKKQLEIWVPDVHANHNAPGFRAASSEYPLTYGPYKQYEMRLKRSDGTDIYGQMAIKPDGLVSRTIAVYGERAASGCKLNTNTASLSLVVPKPDTIWPEASADEIENVVDDAASSQGQFSNQNGGKYATRVVLRYDDVKPDTSVIYGGATPYTPDVTPIGDEARITLEVSPQPESIPAVAHLQSAIAFEQMMRMMNIVSMINYHPHLCYPMDGTQCPLTSLRIKQNKSEMGHSASQNRSTMENDSAVPPGGVSITSTTAKDCHAPLMLVCMSNACNLLLQ